MRRDDQDEWMDETAECKMDECGDRVVNVDHVDRLPTQQGEQLMQRAR
jgi:hypothetical protein